MLRNKRQQQMQRIIPRLLEVRTSEQFDNIVKANRCSKREIEKYKRMFNFTF